jgi:hypothetical protein
MDSTQAPASKKHGLIKRLLRKVVILAIATLVLGWLYGWASPWAFPKNKTSGFGLGILHGALMPLALPSLVLGRDVEIFAADNSGRFYKIGCICGIDICGLVFIGPLFWRPKHGAADHKNQRR